MRVRMRTLYATPRGAYHPDQTVDLPRDEAMRLIDAGYAVPADVDPAASPSPGTSRARQQASAPRNRARAGGGDSKDRKDR